MAKGARQARIDARKREARIVGASGLLFMLPVAWSAGMNPDSRWFPRARSAYAGWGVSLYVLGFLLAWQVARIQTVGLHSG